MVKNVSKMINGLKSLKKKVSKRQKAGILAKKAMNGIKDIGNKIKPNCIKHSSSVVQIAEKSLKVTMVLSFVLINASQPIAENTTWTM